MPKFVKFLKNLKRKFKGDCMSKEDVIEFEGVVEEVLPNTTFKVRLSNGHVITAYLAGKMRVNNIKVYVGDNVKVAMSPYDLMRGRIVYRSKN